MAWESTSDQVTCNDTIWHMIIIAWDDGSPYPVQMIQRPYAVCAHYKD